MPLPMISFSKGNRLRRSFLAAIVGLGIAPAIAQVDRATPEYLARAQPSVDRLLVVDCLLPGQVRRLGPRMTYLTARRPVKLTADECGLRGGEYVQYDRADLATALSAWLPLAKEGDSQAQTYVGEIYERGVGTEPPRHADAASWYRRAADQGHARAMINLDFLYEKGLGVPRDPAAALALYRRAAGLGDAIALEGVDAAVREQELRTLRRELAETRRQLDEARRELDRVRGGARSERQRLEEEIRRAQRQGDGEAVTRLEKQLSERDIELQERGRQVAQLAQTAERYRLQLESLEAETASLREQLVALRGRLAGSEAELAARAARTREDEARLQALRDQLDRERKAADNSAEVRRLEAQLKLSEQELARQREDMARVEREARDTKQKLVELETRVAQEKEREKATAVAMAPPSIQLIDPPLVVARSPATIKVRGQPAARDLIGMVTAPAGLLSFTINDASHGTDERGMFKASIALRGAQTPVSLVAVDRQGKRATLDFVLVPDQADIREPSPVPPYVSGVEFGGYHALVIGNQDYRQLPTLDTSIADAKAVADVLSRKYGFKVTLLVNATRYEILSTLNKLRDKLTEKDNFVLFYAGHGEIDRANLRGHWLPIDAEPGNDANWISNVAITDILNAMSVKHAMVIADSCYSGMLTRSSVGRLETGASDEARVRWIKAIVNARVRTVLTSGGVQPVMDGGGGEHSVFARSLLEVLEGNEDALEAQRLYREVAARVLDRASRFGVEQRPEYAPLKFAGHESGDFLFVPTRLLASK